MIDVEGDPIKAYKPAMNEIKFVERLPPGIGE